MLTQNSLTDKKYKDSIKVFFKSLPGSPLCLGTTRPHQYRVDIITVMPAAHWHVDGLAAGVHAADGGVAESRRAADGGAPGPSACWVHRTGTRSLFATPYAGDATPVQGTAATAAWYCGGGVQGPPDDWVCPRVAWGLEMTTEFFMLSAEVTGACLAALPPKSLRDEERETENKTKQ